MKDRLQKHIDNARSDRYRSSPSEWIQSLLEHDERPVAHILETIYPCWALHARDEIGWWMRSPQSGGGSNQQAGFAYDIYVSEREIRHILHFAALGQPLVNMVGNGHMMTAQEALSGLDTAGINFLTVEQKHPIWGMIRARVSPPSAEWLREQSSTEAIEENIELLMQNARTRRGMSSDAP